MRRAVAVVIALAALGCAGCGDTTQDTAPAPPPKLPRALAQSWAQRADAIATALAAGDGCTAETQAVALRTEVTQAVDERRIAPRLADRLVGAVNGLPERIPCTPAAPEPPKHGHDHPRKDKHGKHGDKGD